MSNFQQRPMHAPTTTNVPTQATMAVVPPMPRMSAGLPAMPAFAPFPPPPMPSAGLGMRPAPPPMPPVPPGMALRRPMMAVRPPMPNPVVAPLPPKPIVQPAAPPTPKPQPPRQQEATERPKTSTVFVGNITEAATDTLIRQLLMKCGTVVSWKRIQGATGKLQPFGFCEYSDPEATLRALRLLHSLQVGDRELLAKVDEKNRKQLDEYLSKKKDHPATSDGDRSNITKVDSISAEITHEQKEEDKAIKAEISLFLKANSSVLTGRLQMEFMKDSARPDSMDIKLARSEENLEDLEMDTDQKNLISREIRIFRETYKDKEKEKEKEKERETERREKERSQEREKRRTTESRSREQSIEVEMDESKVIEKRRFERKQREHEAAYRSELRNWEARERKKSREYEKDHDREEKLKKETAREARHLFDFLASYDDDEDDHRFYKGSAFARLLREREAEIAADDRDRQRESEQREKVAESKYAKQSHSEPAIKTQETVFKAKPVDVPPVPPLPPYPSAKQSDDVLVSTVAKRTTDDRKEIVQSQPVNVEENKKGNFGLSLKIGLSSAKQPSLSSVTSTKKKKLDPVFNDEEDERSVNEHGRKRKLVPLEYTEEEMKAITPVVMTPDEKKRRIKSIMENIPAQKEKLFEYPLNWSLVDESLIEKRMRTWVIKKITEYIGEEEPTLVDFICEKVKEHNPPMSIVKDLEMVLDDEAEVFVMKLWRLLIYETEAKKMGIVSVK